MDAILKDTIERCPAPICIGPHQINSSSKPYVIAEIGVNHNGDADQARRLIDAAHQAGADAAKFQVFSAGALATADAQALVMAAAVADYRPRLASPQKLKKDSDSMTLELTRNPDILTETTGPIVKVGFAAESQDLAQNAREKMAKKGLDLIVANDITDPESGFGSDSNKVLILGKNGQVEDLPLMSKEAVAHRVLDKVRDLMAAEKG